jgi:putative ABC transport system permease protein
MALVAHGEGDVARLSGPIRELIRKMDPSVPAENIRTMAEIRAGSIADRELTTLLLNIFGFIALFLATIGVYGTVASSVSQRRHEMGVRMALGARSADVRRMVVVQGIRPVAIGLGLGLIAATASTTVLEGLLYNVSPTDPVTFVAVAAILVAVAVLASTLPARRAARVDPMTVLRSE